MINAENFPEAECSKCGAGLAVGGKEENGQVIITVEPCTCPDEEGQEKHVILKFGELDEMPEAEAHPIQKQPDGSASI